MKWERAQINGKEQSTGIQSGEYRIGKYFVLGNQRYAAWYGNALVGRFAGESGGAEAKAACESHLLSLRPEISGHGRARKAIPSLPAAVGSGESAGLRA